MTIKRNIAVVGARGAIGKAFVEYYSKDESVENVFAFSRKKINFENKKIKSFDLDIENQTSIADAAQNIKDYAVDTIQGFTIDSLNLPTDRPVVMKMDVERHELQALLGALEFIREANIVLILIEHTTEELQKDRDGWKKVFDLLSSKGLVPFRLDSGKETELNPNNLDEWRHPIHPQFDAIWRKKTD